MKLSQIAPMAVRVRRPTVMSMAVKRVLASIGKTFWTGWKVLSKIWAMQLEDCLVDFEYDFLEFCFIILR